MKHAITILLMAAGLCMPAAQAKTSKKTVNKDIVSGTLWKDEAGDTLNAHGAGMLYYNGTYYLYGEYKTGKTILPSWATWECYRTDVTGVSCYSSKDLVNWKFEGLALKAEPNDPNSDLHPSKVLERPKVVYNPTTKKFVMWAHVESADYSKAAAGVAVSDSPTGPFRYLGSFRPNNAMSRDQTVFVDDDGKAYQFCSSENNATLYINELTDDYLKPTGKFTRNFIKLSREAPAVFKHEGKYYMLTSGCTGWDPNVAELAVADSVMGPWKMLSNPCTGPEADKTFYAQSTYVQPVYGRKNAYLAMFDRWNKKDLANSRYVWLPVKFDSKGTITIPWKERWNPATEWERTDSRNVYLIHEYDIKSRRFDETAQAIAHASGCFIKTDLSKTGAVKVNPVKGKMSLLDAVRTAIKGTSLKVKAVNNGQEIVVE